MNPNRQKRIELAERRQKIAAMYVRGATQFDIGKELGISQSQVSLDLKSIRKQWLESAIRDFDAIKSEQLAKLEWLEAEAHAAWFRSTKAAKQIKVKMVAGTEAERERLIKGQCGDPRFLEIVADCVKQRRQIFGLDAPAKSSVDITASPLLKLLDEIDAKQTCPTSDPS